MQTIPNFADTNDIAWHYKENLSTLHLNIQHLPRNGYLKCAKAINEHSLHELVCIELSRNGLFDWGMCQACPVARIINKLL